MRNLFRGLNLLTLLVFALAFNACEKDNELMDAGNNETATCIDGIQNGDETGIDCGGSCDPCEVAPSCTDGIQNGDETGVDCGGSCTPCGVAPSCTDGIQNGDETGVDCGGSCDPCEVAPSCTDGIQNGDETGVDCGGSCAPCEVVPSCTDGIQNGDETGIDCGGSCDPCTSSLMSMRDYIAQTPQFSMLNAAIERANFSSNLEGDGPFTFFAANNAAWQELLDDNGWTSIDQVSSSVLNTILQFQFSNLGSYTSDQFVNNFQITVLYQSKKVHIDLSDPNNPKVIAGLTSANIIEVDQMTTNGVIHEIDKVLLF